MAKFKVEGLADLKRNCRRLQAAIRPAARKACEAGAEVIAKEARSTAPVDSGEFASKIKVVKAPIRGPRVEAAVVVDRRDFESGFHPGHLEFGTSKMDARPTLGPAFDRKEDEAALVVAVAIAGALEGLL